MYIYNALHFAVTCGVHVHVCVCVPEDCSRFRWTDELASELIRLRTISVSVPSAGDIASDVGTKKLFESCCIHSNEICVTTTVVQTNFLHYLVKRA